VPCLFMVAASAKRGRRELKTILVGRGHPAVTPGQRRRRRGQSCCRAVLRGDKAPLQPARAMHCVPRQCRYSQIIQVTVCC
jgi:hypothetical protein